MSFNNYSDSQWSTAPGAGYDVGAAAAGAQAWDHQTPPTRSGASSTNPREEAAAFYYQFQQVEKAWSEMIKSGKMQSGMGMIPVGRQPRISGGPGRPHSPGFAGRGGPGHPSSNLQNFFATQRHQPSRGSNDADQAQQHKRRLAAQRERELRNYHQEQQYHRTTTYPAGPQDVSAGPGPANPNTIRPGRTFSPGGTSEVPHQELIARQQSALYGSGPFGEAAGYIDENGAPRQGLPVHQGGPPNMRGGSSPLTFEYGRSAPPHQEAGAQVTDPASAGAQPRERTSSNASPQSNPPGPKGPLEQANRTSNSSPGSASPQNGRAPGGKAVAPIGTRPTAAQGPAMPKQYAPSLSGSSEAPSSSNAGTTTVSTTVATDGSSSLTGVGNWGQRSGGPWGSSKTQTSVWG